MTLKSPWPPTWVVLEVPLTPNLGRAPGSRLACFHFLLFLIVSFDLSSVAKKWSAISPCSRFEHEKLMVLTSITLAPRYVKSPSKILLKCEVRFKALFC